MTDQTISCPSSTADIVRELKHDEDEEDFCSCFEDDDVWKDTEEVIKEDDVNKHILDEFSVKLFFKGTSIDGVGESACGFSGIGVVMERAAEFPLIQVQKKLDFYVEDSVADYLALMDGIVAAVEKNIRHVYAFTDSQALYDQMKHEEKLETPLQIALRERILEHTSNLETFFLNLVPSSKLEKALRLSQLAIGVVSSSPIKGEKSQDNCSICCEDKPSPMTVKLKCSHKFCSQCMKTLIDEKIESSQVPIQCPQSKCKYYISKQECKTFLPLDSYESLEKVLGEANIDMERIYCPYPHCSVLFDPQESLLAKASSSSHSDSSCIECPACQRYVCFECGVPWHSGLSCEEYQSLPLDERDTSDITLNGLSRNKRWRRCQQCHRMTELSQGCYHMTCWCGFEFCFSCGAEYRDAQPSCQCAFWEEDDSEEDSVSHSAQASEQWAWEAFNSLPMTLDAYSEQERSQLALIQRFLAGGFSLGDHQTYQSPPRCTDSYGDAIKDLHQLPWLERFVSVISDDFYEDYVQ